MVKNKNFVVAVVVFSVTLIGLLMFIQADSKRSDLTEISISSDQISTSE